MNPRTAARIATAAIVFALGSPPGSAGLAVDASAHLVAGVHDGALQAEGTLSLFAADGGDPPLADQTVATGPLSIDPVCSGTCTVETATAPGFIPPVLALESGSSVVWRSTDIGHVQRETTSPLDVSACFTMASPGNGDSAPVRFDVVGGVLNATTGGVSRTCDSAVGNAAAGFALAYHCTLHANMRGAILVVP